MSVNLYVEEIKVSQKVCPMAMSANGSAQSCVGSNCMAWRWAETHINDGQGGMVLSGDTYGFCGMAGIPTGGRQP